MWKATKNGQSIRIPAEMRTTYAKLGYSVEPYDSAKPSAEAKEELPVEEPEAVKPLDEMSMQELKDKAKSLNVYSKSLKTRELLIEAINEAGTNEEPA